MAEWWESEDAWRALEEQDPGFTEWAHRYAREHGHYPGGGNRESLEQAISNREWSQEFAATQGGPPGPQDWKTHYYRPEEAKLPDYGQHWPAAVGMVSKAFQPDEYKAPGLSGIGDDQFQGWPGQQPGQVGVSPVASGATDWEALLRQEAEAQGLADYYPVLRAIVDQESGGDPTAVNPSSGATGLMQVMPSDVSEQYGGVFEGRPSQQELLDPITNIREGVADFKRKLDAAGGDVVQALTNYSGGYPVEEYAAPILAQAERYTSQVQPVEQTEPPRAGGHAVPPTGYGQREEGAYRLREDAGQEQIIPGGAPIPEILDTMRSRPPATQALPAAGGDPVQQITYNVLSTITKTLNQAMAPFEQAVGNYNQMVERVQQAATPQPVGYAEALNRMRQVPEPPTPDPVQRTLDESPDPRLRALGQVWPHMGTALGMLGGTVLEGAKLAADTALNHVFPTLFPVQTMGFEAGIQLAKILTPSTDEVLQYIDEPAMLVEQTLGALALLTMPQETKARAAELERRRQRVLELRAQGLEQSVEYRQAEWEYQQMQQAERRRTMQALQTDYYGAQGIGPSVGDGLSQLAGTSTEDLQAAWEFGRAGLYTSPGLPALAWIRARQQDKAEWEETIQDVARFQNLWMEGLGRTLLDPIDYAGVPVRVAWKAWNNARIAERWVKPFSLNADDAAEAIKTANLNRSTWQRIVPGYTVQARRSAALTSTDFVTQLVMMDAADPEEMIARLARFVADPDRFLLENGLRHSRGMVEGAGVLRRVAGVPQQARKIERLTKQLDALDVVADRRLAQATAAELQRATKVVPERGFANYLDNALEEGRKQGLAGRELQEFILEKSNERIGQVLDELVPDSSANYLERFLGPITGSKVYRGIMNTLVMGHMGLNPSWLARNLTVDNTVRLIDGYSPFMTHRRAMHLVDELGLEPRGVRSPAPVKTQAVGGRGSRDKALMGVQARLERHGGEVVYAQSATNTYYEAQRRAVQEFLSPDLKNALTPDQYRYLAAELPYAKNRQEARDIVGRLFREEVDLRRAFDPETMQEAQELGTEAVLRQLQKATSPEARARVLERRLKDVDDWVEADPLKGLVPRDSDNGRKASRLAAEAPEAVDPTLMDAATAQKLQQELAVPDAPKVAREAARRVRQGSDTPPKNRISWWYLHETERTPRLHTAQNATMDAIEQMKATDPQRANELHQAFLSTRHTNTERFATARVEGDKLAEAGDFEGKSLLWNEAFMDNTLDMEDLYRQVTGKEFQFDADAYRRLLRQSGGEPDLPPAAAPAPPKPAPEAPGGAVVAPEPEPPPRPVAREVAETVGEPAAEMTAEQATQEQPPFRPVPSQQAVAELRTVGREAGITNDTHLLNALRKDMDLPEGRTLARLQDWTDEELQRATDVMRQRATRLARERAAIETQAPRQVVDTFPVDEIEVDPTRFQFKLGASEQGTTGALSDVQKWDPNLASGVQLWRDPADGQVYVVNGHHRVALAKRLGVEDMPGVYLIEADTAEAARAAGALKNISEGRGTPIDAAKFFRDWGLSADDLAERGVSMRESLVAQGAALANLNDLLFNSVVRGEFPQNWAVVIGQKLPDHDAQTALLRLLEKDRRNINEGVLSELIDLVQGAPSTGATQATLFGMEAIQQTNAVEKAGVMAYVRQELSRDRRLFGTVAGQADRLQTAGNVIDVAQSRGVSQEAAQLLDIWDSVKNQQGEIGDILNDAARRIAGGENARKVQQEAYEQIREALPRVIRGTEGPSGAGVPQGSLFGAAEAPGTTPQRGPSPQVARAEGTTSPPGQQGQSRLSSFLKDEEGAMRLSGSARPWRDAKTGEPITINGYRGQGRYGGLTEEQQAKFGREFLLGDGVYIAPTETGAAAFGDPRPVSITLKNPYVIDYANGESLRALDLDAIRAAGHDGIIIKRGQWGFGRGQENLAQAVVFSEYANALSPGHVRLASDAIDRGVQVRIKAISGPEDYLQQYRSDALNAVGKTGTVSSVDDTGLIRVRVGNRTVVFSPDEIEVVQQGQSRLSSFLKDEEGVLRLPYRRPDWADELESVGGKIDDDGTVLLYHATTKDNAEKILQDGVLRRPADAPDSYGVYFSSSREVAQDYGDGTVIAVRVRASDIQPDDVFPGRRMDFTAPTRGGIYRPVAVGDAALQPRRLSGFLSGERGSVNLPSRKEMGEQIKGFLRRAADSLSGKKAPAKLPPLSPEAKKLLRGERWRQFEEAINLNKTVAAQAGARARDFAFHNYDAKTSADSLAALLLMYPFWASRTYPKMAMRILQHPTILAGYLRYKRALWEQNKDLPEWYRNQLRITQDALPWLPKEFLFNIEAMLNPAYNLTTQFERPGQDDSPFGWIMEQADKYGFSPHMWMIAAYAADKYMSGKPAEAQAALGYPAPVLRTFRDVTAMMGINGGKGLEIVPWNWWGGLSEPGIGGDYWTRRRVAANVGYMTMTGDLTPQEAREAAIALARGDMDNPAVQEAMKREAQERAPSNLIGFLFGAGLKPRSESEAQLEKDYATLNQIYADATEMTPEEFAEALNQFYRERPYMRFVSMGRAELDKAETSYLYDIFFSMPPGQRDTVYERYGDEQMQGIVNKALDAKDVSVLDDEERIRLNMFLAAMSPQYPPPEPGMAEEWRAVSKAYSAMEDEADRKFGGAIGFTEALRMMRDPERGTDFRRLLQEYYEADPETRAAMRDQYPQINEYFDWKEQYMRDDPLLMWYYGPPPREQATSTIWDMWYALEDKPQSREDLKSDFDQLAVDMGVEGCGLEEGSRCFTDFFLNKETREIEGLPNELLLAWTLGLAAAGAVVGVDTDLYRTAEAEAPGQQRVAPPEPLVTRPYQMGPEPTPEEATPAAGLEVPPDVPGTGAPGAVPGGRPAAGEPVAEPEPGRAARPGRESLVPGEWSFELADPELDALRLERNRLLDLCQQGVQDACQKLKDDRFDIFSSPEWRKYYDEVAPGWRTNDSGFYDDPLIKRWMDPDTRDSVDPENVIRRIDELKEALPDITFGDPAEYAQARDENDLWREQSKALMPGTMAYRQAQQQFAQEHPIWAKYYLRPQTASSLADYAARNWTYAPSGGGGGSGRSGGGGGGTSGGASYRYPGPWFNPDYYRGPQLDNVRASPTRSDLWRQVVASALGRAGQR